MQNTADAEIAALEKIITETQEKLIQLKKQRTNHEVVQDYVLHNWDGTQSRLSELFGAKDDLIVVHNMGQSCNYCTLWADGLNGFTKPFNDRAAFVVVSPDPVDTQKSFAASRGWNFRMLSTHGLPFVKDMGFCYEDNGRLFYNPGFSTFRKQADGSIVRVAFDYFGPGDFYCSPWHMFELLDQGVNDWHPKKNYD